MCVRVCVCVCVCARVCVYVCSISLFRIFPNFFLLLESWSNYKNVEKKNQKKLPPALSKMKACLTLRADQS